jgi:glycosyltransferase involved in cell wall biosynthesis
MPVFNGAETIAQAICSILNQTFGDWELLIIDDGSKDNTFEIAASFDDPRIIVTRGENKGLGARLNDCIDRAKGKFFARMDQDDIAYPRRLQCQVEFLRSHTDVDLVAGWLVVFRNDGTAFGTRRSALTHEQVCARPWRGIPLAHPTWMGKAEWFRLNRYSSDAIRMEDQELLFRTHRNSRFATVPEIVLGYREDTLSLRKLLISRKNLCKVLFNNGVKRHQFLSATIGIVAHAAKGLVDTFAICSGLNYRILRHRARLIRLEEEKDWRSVWEQTKATSDKYRDANQSCGT